MCLDLVKSLQVGDGFEDCINRGHHSIDLLLIFDGLLVSVTHKSIGDAGNFGTIPRKKGFSLFFENSAGRIRCSVTGASSFDDGILGLVGLVRAEGRKVLRHEMVICPHLITRHAELWHAVCML